MKQESNADKQPMPRITQMDLAAQSAGSSHGPARLRETEGAARRIRVFRVHFLLIRVRFLLASRGREPGIMPDFTRPAETLAFTPE